MDDPPLVLTRLAADEGPEVNPVTMRSSTSSPSLRLAKKGTGAMVAPSPSSTFPTSDRSNSASNHQTNTTAATAGSITAVAKQRTRPSSASSMESMMKERSNKNKSMERDASSNNESSKPSAASLRRQADLDMQAYVDSIVQRVQQQRIQEQIRNKEIRKTSIVCIQAWIRGFLVRRRHKGIPASPIYQNTNQSQPTPTIEL